MDTMFCKQHGYIPETNFPLLPVIPGISKVKNKEGLQSINLV
jgi:hypothetical protein